MPSRSARPIGFALCLIAAALLAAPTLFFPADSPTEPKLVFAVVGAAAFGLAVITVGISTGEACAVDGFLAWYRSAW